MQKPLIAWPRRHPIWSVVIVVVVLLLAMAAWLGLSTWKMVQGLQKVSDVASTASSQLSGSHLDSLATTVGAAQQVASEAVEASDSLGVRLASELPFIGDDISTLRAVSAVADDLLASAKPLVATLPKLAADGGGFDLTELATLPTSLKTLQDAVARSSEKLAGQDTSDLLAPLADKVVPLAAGLTQANASLSNIKPFVAALPIILGSNGDRTWLIINQNLGEARVTGGLVSAYVIVTVHDGTLTMQEQGTNDDLIAGAAVPTDSVPRDLYEYWGEEYFNDWASLNLAANFPDTGKLMTAAWNARGGTQVDGTITLGQGIVQYLAAATGPVTVGDRTIQPQDLAEYLTIGVYKDYKKAAQKDLAVALIISQVFSNFADDGISVGSLISAGLGTETADYVQMWSTHSSEQKQIVAVGVSGSFPSTAGPTASVRFINGAGNKLDSFQDTTVDYTLGACTTDPDTPTSRPGTLTVDVSNEAPTSGLPAYMTGRSDLSDGTKYTLGSTRKLVVIYTPLDVINVNTVTVDGEETGASYGYENGRQFLILDLDFEPGQTRNIVVSWDEPAQDDDGKALSAHPSIILPPLINAATVTTHTEGVCTPTE